MENIGGIFLVFLNVVTPVFILVVIGYFVGPRLKIDARSLSRTAYFVFIPAFVFNIISEAKIDSELALQMLSFILVAQIAVALLGFLVGKALRQSREITAAFVLIATFGNVGKFWSAVNCVSIGRDSPDLCHCLFCGDCLYFFCNLCWCGKLGPQRRCDSCLFCF